MFESRPPEAQNLDPEDRLFRALVQEGAQLRPGIARGTASTLACLATWRTPADAVGRLCPQVINGQRRDEVRARGTLEAVDRWKRIDAVHEQTRPITLTHL